MPTIHIVLVAVKDNLRVTVRGVSSTDVHRENQTTFIKMQIGSQTLELKIPP